MQVLVVTIDVFVELVLFKLMKDTKFGLPNRNEPKKEKTIACQ